CNFGPKKIRIFMKKTILANLFLVILSITCFAYSSDSLLYTNHIYSEKIRTVQLFKEGWNLSNPVIKLRSSDKLVLQFDLLGSDPETYYYSFIHCDKDWKKSGIYPADWLEGFPENQIEEYKSSFNTTVNYFHYKLSFPNIRTAIKVSGNYILIVFPAGEPDKPVLTRRFMVTEDAVRISATAQRPQMTDSYNTGQQVNFTINYGGININDPYRDVSTFILQNGQWTNAKRNLKPDFIGNNELKYSSLSDDNIFRGGNEFRYFDIKSIRYQSEFVRKIDFTVNNYHVFLFPSENREFKPYFYWQDFNGKYYIAVQEGRDTETDADYVWVYFTLPSKYRVVQGNMYVAGALSDWAFNSRNLMTYDPERAEYQCSMLLKQGWYNFEYIFLKNGDKTAEPSVFEGNHYETENDYLILVYYRNPGDRYDRIIGSLTVNTARKNQN
ncbi:MAG: hypothetical protein C0408_07315, partial [Odoribacter sp.]|nr:hypothetical protein [Odoribacter sp.]